MAARINKRQSEQTKAAIQTGALIKALNNCALGKNDMTSNQIKSAHILLKFQIPELKAIEITGELTTNRQMTDAEIIQAFESKTNESD